MKKNLLVTLTLVSALAAFPAFALDLQEARASGMVAEKQDGYLSAISKSGDVSKLVSDVNNKRQAEYARISKENGQPVAVVGKLAAEQIINGLPKGAQYQAADGSFKAK